MATLLRAVIDSSGMSRRKAFAAIREGRVSVNGITVTEPSTELGRGVIAVDGEPLQHAPWRKTYVLLNKPPGYVTTREDEMGRWTVLDLIPANLRAPGLHPAGRLDKDTSGLLILTDDGDLTYHLTHPSHEIEKEYWVGLSRRPSDALLEALLRGVEIDGQIRRPLSIWRLENAGPFTISIAIGEGRKRQVRRMFEALGARVRELRRVREGPLELGDLREGKSRRLSAGEVEALKADATGEH